MPLHILDYLDDLPPESWGVVIFPSRRELRECLEQYNQEFDPIYRTKSLHRGEYIERRDIKSRLYLRTRRQIITYGRNRKIDGSVFALLHPAVTLDPVMLKNLYTSGIKELIPYMEGEEGDD